MNEAKINRFSDMVSKSGNQSLAKFWNEIVEDIEFWGLISEENKHQIIQKAEKVGYNIGFADAYKNCIEQLKDNSRTFEFMQEVVDKKPKYWKNYVNFLLGSIGKDELWH